MEKNLQPDTNSLRKSPVQSSKTEANVFNTWFTLDSNPSPDILKIIEALALSDRNEALLRKMQQLKTCLEKDSSDKYKINMGNVRVDIRDKSSVTFEHTFGLPQMFDHFTGRGNKLKKLMTNFGFCQNNHSEEILEVKKDSYLQVIVGTGGIGKTQLANYFVRQMLSETRYDWVVWLNARVVDEKNSLMNQFEKLAKQLGIKNIDTYKNNETDLIEKIYYKLHKKGRGIVVFDDLVNYRDIESILPNKFNCVGIDVLITSCDPLNWSQNCKIVHLGVFKEGDATEYIRKIVKPEKFETEQVELLAKLLGYFPLALTQAIAYINNNPGSINDYIQDFNRTKESRKVYLNSEPFKDDPHKATVYTTVNLSLQKVNNIYSRQILHLCSYLASETLIDVKFIRSVIKKNKTNNYFKTAIELLLLYYIINDINSLSWLKLTLYIILFGVVSTGIEHFSDWLFHLHHNDQISVSEFNHALSELKRYSLVESIKDTDHVKMHRMVQILITLDDERAQTVSWLKNISQHMINYLQNIDFDLLTENYGLSYIQHLDYLASTLLKINTVDTSTSIYAQLYYTQGHLLNSLQRHYKAKLMIEKALIIFKRLLGEQHLTVIFTEMYLGKIYIEVGEMKQAQICFETIKKKLKDKGQIKLNNSDVETKIAECDLYIGLSMISDNPTEAKKYLSTVLPIYKSKQGATNPLVIKCETKLNETIDMVSDLKSGICTRTEAFLLSELERLDSIEDNSALEKAKTETMLGIVYLANKKFSLSRKYFESAFSIFKLISNENDFYFLFCGMNCAILSSDIRHAQVFLSTLKKSLGDSHNLIVQSELFIGFNLINSDPRTAKAYIDTALPKMIKKYGIRDKCIAQCNLYLGVIALKLSDPTNALPNLESAYDVLKSECQATDENIIYCMVHLGAGYIMSQKYIEAKSIFESLRAILISSKSDDVRLIALCDFGLGTAYLYLSDHVSAYSHFNNGFLLSPDDSKNHLLYAMNRFHFGVVCLCLKKYMQSHENLSIAMSLLIELKVDNKIISNCLTCLGAVLLELDHLEEAEDNLQRAVLLNQKIYESDSIEFAKLYGILGELYYRKGNYSKAYSMLFDSVKIFTQHLGIDHPDTHAAITDMSIVKRCLDKENVDKVSVNSAIQTGFFSANNNNAVVPETGIAIERELKDENHL